MFSRVQFRTGTKKSNQDTDNFLLKKNVTLRMNTDIRNDYKIEEYLGSGKFGEVKRCQENGTGREFAAKFVPISNEDDMKSVKNEIAIMNTLKHPRLIQLYDAYHLHNEVTMVIELITGGELFERIIDDKFDLNESKCIKFMHEILQGVEYIHSQNVIHLDLKPENILCLSSRSFKIKIIDFGLARFFTSKDMCVLFGTPEFVSPEVITYEPVCPAADMWSLGVICYVMLSGLSPFMGDSQSETLANIMKVKFNFNYPEFNEISQDAMDFIRRLLVKSPKQRMTASECLQHTWLKKRKLPKRSGTVSKKSLRHFVYRRKWQKAVNAIIALHRMGMVVQHSPITKPSNQEPIHVNTKSVSTLTDKRSNSKDSSKGSVSDDKPTRSIGLFRRSSLFKISHTDDETTTIKPKRKENKLLFSIRKSHKSSSLPKTSTPESNSSSSGGGGGNKTKSNQSIEHSPTAAKSAKMKFSIKSQLVHKPTDSTNLTCETSTQNSKISQSSSLPPQSPKQQLEFKQGGKSKKKTNISDSSSITAKINFFSKLSKEQKVN